MSPSQTVRLTPTCLTSGLVLRNSICKRLFTIIQCNLKFCYFCLRRFFKYSVLNSIFTAVFESTFKIYISHFFSDIFVFTFLLWTIIIIWSMNKTLILPDYHNKHSCKIYHMALAIYTLEGAISKKGETLESIFGQIQFPELCLSQQLSIQRVPLLWTRLK